jgi:hypothetical protein
MSTSLALASIMNLDASGTPAVQCMFNPSEYTFAKQNTWVRADAKGANVPQLEFGGGGAATLTLQLFFDTYSGAKGNSGEIMDVRKRYTDAVWKLMLVEESLKDPKTNKARPPKVRFQWGKAWSFDAVITSITQRFTLFLPDGTPVRASLDVTFEQIKDASFYPSQNPTSGGEGGRRLWTVKHGDTLAGIAYQEYGDPNAWRRIADHNRLTEVRRLRPGQVLELPNA